MRRLIAAAVVLGASLAATETFGQGDLPLAAEIPTSSPADHSGGDDFDALLQLAEQDVSQLTQVKVSERVPSLDTVVTTVSQTPSTVGKSPAAVFVITNEMIRRSGATNIPDVLRMAPGVNVAKVDSSHWAVSIRGFNDLFTNKLLVQIDGRSIYTSLFGGIFWSARCPVQSGSSSVADQFENGHREFVSFNGGTVATGVRGEVCAGISIWR